MICLPENFNPRLFLYKKKAFLIARNDSDRERFKLKIERGINRDLSKESRHILGFKNVSNLIINYGWSLKRYHKLCGKIGFEFLCLLEDGRFCNNPEFDKFKYRMLQDKPYDEIIIPYNYAKGFQLQSFIKPGWVDYVDIDKTLMKFPTLSSLKVNCHKIFIYEVNRHILINVQLFNLEQCQLIIAKNIRLDNIYYIEYNYVDDSLQFYVHCKNEPYKLLTGDFSSEVEIFKSEGNIIQAICCDTNHPSFLYKSVF